MIIMKRKIVAALLSLTMLGSVASQFAMTASAANPIVAGDRRARNHPAGRRAQRAGEFRTDLCHPSIPHASG